MAKLPINLFSRRDFVILTFQSLKIHQLGAFQNMAGYKQSLEKLIVVGDRVLIKPKSAPDKTRSGLFLPPGYTEKESIQSGYVVKTGPGYPLPVLPSDDFEPWKQQDDQTKYMPLQAKPGDMAIFLQKGALEVMYHNERYYIVPHQSILLLERDDFVMEE
jgi:chaperonin GroES